jgi:CRISPR/Cas system-associated exonuclease Cas4 (RecB family)
MKLSYSAISSYLDCPLKYYFSYVEKRPTPDTPALAFGKSVHEALRWLYDVKTPEPHTASELLDYLDECWLKEGYSSPEERLRYFLHARSVLDLYYRNNIVEGEALEMPVALEHKFLIDLGFCELSGVIDRMDRLPDGTFEIMDYKTNRRMPPAKKLARDLQLPLYTAAAEKIWEVEVSRATFYYLVLNHTHSVHVGRERVDEALDEVRNVAAAVSDERFDPCKNNLCPWCDFIRDCPVWEGRSLPEKKASWTPPLSIEEIVDEVVVMQRQVEEHRTRIEQKLAGIDALSKAVGSFLRDRGAERVSGRCGTARLDDEGTLEIGKTDAGTPAPEPDPEKSG